MQQQGLGRFFKHSLIGGTIGGILSAIPILNYLNCCFCLLNVLGAVIATNLYLGEHPSEKITAGEAATIGGIAGAISGLIIGIVGSIIQFVLQEFLMGLLGQSSNPWEELFRTLGVNFGAGASIGMFLLTMIFTTMVSIPLYAIFGAIGSLGFASLFKKDRMPQ